MLKIRIYSTDAYLFTKSETFNSVNLKIIFETSRILNNLLKNTQTKRKQKHTIVFKYKILICFFVLFYSKAFLNIINYKYFIW